MKKSYAFAFASGLLMLGSCANEAPEQSGQQTDSTDDGVGYLRIEFPNITSAESRAFAEEESTEAESKVEEAAFVFYYGPNNNQSFTRYAHPTKQPGDQAEWVTTDESHFGTKCAIVKLHRMVNAVAVVINGEKTYSGDLNADTWRVSKYARGIGSDPNQLFYMSSARYYTTNGADAQLTNLTPITGEMLFKSADEAISAENKDKAVVVNVEHYVAKVKVRNTYSDKYQLDADGYIDPLAQQGANKEVNAVVKFKPMYTCLTAYSTSASTIKKLPEWSSLPTYAQNWGDINSPTGRWSSWLRDDDCNIKWPSLTELESGAPLFGAKSNAYNSSESIYCFDNNDQNDAKTTSVVVCGQYKVTDAAGNDLAAADGTFWLVAFADKFEVYKSEREALLAMGGEEGDKLVPDGVVEDNLAVANPAVPGASDLKWTNWTGWMRIYNKDIVTRCIKYNRGYGYYAQHINHYQGTDAVVRNHIYSCNITGIGGMGVGIPSNDDPIVPVTPPKPSDQNYWLHMSVKVLPWRIINNSMNWE